jgi:pimeloyl-ACP methyl ester carboxylesterase
MKSNATAEAPRLPRKTPRIAEGERIDFPRRFSRRLGGCIFFILSALLAAGCATKPIYTSQPNLAIVVPGIGGDGDVYARIVCSLHDRGSSDCLRVSDWGSSLPIFFISISSQSWHKNVERHLADQILEWRSGHPNSRIALIAHSAGAGVVAGAVAQLPGGVRVGPIIFLAPALSPGFDLRPMLRHATIIHVFFSTDDFFWQGIGPTIFGNYDRVHSSGAGRVGFTLAVLNPSEKARVIQHPYQRCWKALDNDGGHYDWMAGPFVGAVLKPLIDARPPAASIAAGTGRSSSASSN